MFNKLIFYSHYGNGDLFESREFIRDIKNLIPAKVYSYAHGKPKRMFKDIPWLDYMQVDSKMEMRSPSKIIDNCLYINTWIGRDSKYVLPQIGCVIENSHRMFNDILRPYNVQLSKDIYEYLPEIDNFYFDYFKPETTKNVLFCNGHVQSHQAANFDFSSVIRSLGYIFPTRTFYITTDIPEKLDNIIFTGDYITTPDGFDLNEIACFAQYCDIIIGRKSGPAVFAHTKDTWYSDKISLSFTYAKTSSHFVLSDHLPLRKRWSPEIEHDKILIDCIKAINGKV